MDSYISVANSRRTKYVDFIHRDYISYKLKLNESLYSYINL